MARGFSGALFRDLPLRYSRSLLSRSRSDAGARAFGREIPQLRWQLHRLPDRARRTAGRGRDAGAEAPEVSEARAGLGAKSAAGATDEVGRSRGALLRNGGTGTAGGRTGR